MLSGFIEGYRVTIMFTAPTALRAIGEMLVNFFFFEMLGGQGGLRTLRALFFAGERSEPSVVKMYQRLLSEYCAGGAMVIDSDGLPSLAVLSLESH